MTALAPQRGKSAIRLSPDVLRWVSLAAVAAIVMLIGSGGWVRLSGSGLGCPTWPDCTSASVVAPDTYHALVEFVNRCVITAVGVIIGAAVLAAIFRRPRRRDLLWLTLALAAGYAGEAVLGGLTVLLKLAPALVAAHLILAMFLLTCAVVLHWRSADRPRATAVVPGRVVVLLSDLMLLAVAVTVAAGTVATGAGPHSGSPGTRRFALPFLNAVELHAGLGIFLLGLTVAMPFLLWAQGAPQPIWRRYLGVAGLLAVQGILGYATYFSHVQVDLTEAHVVGAALLVTALLRLRLEAGQAAATSRVPEASPLASPGATAATASAAPRP